MTKFAKILLGVTIAILLLWIIPWAFSFLSSKANNKPFISYSTVIGDFASSQVANGKSTRTDFKGNTYTDSQYDSILPCTYYRQLLNDGRFPETIAGVPVTLSEVQIGNFTYVNKPIYVNYHKIPIYPLLESESGRVELVMPEDVFRFTREGIEFIDTGTNKVNPEKSAKYTQALSAAGFSYPARTVSGNPTTRKEYDNGYLAVDSEGKFFHFKQVKGEPYVKAIDIPAGLEVRYVFETEFRDRKAVGFVVDQNNKLYQVSAHDYRFHKVAIDGYDPTMDAITIIGNMFDWTVRMVSSKGVNSYYAISAKDLSLIKKYVLPEDPKTWTDKVVSFFDKFALHFTDYKDDEVRPRFGY